MMWERILFSHSPNPQLLYRLKELKGLSEVQTFSSGKEIRNFALGHGSIKGQVKRFREQSFLLLSSCQVQFVLKGTTVPGERQEVVQTSREKKLPFTEVHETFPAVRIPHSPETLFACPSSQGSFLCCRHSIGFQGWKSDLSLHVQEVYLSEFFLHLSNCSQFYQT